MNWSAQCKRPGIASDVILEGAFFNSNKKRVPVWSSNGHDWNHWKFRKLYLQFYALDHGNLGPVFKSAEYHQEAMECYRRYDNDSSKLQWLVLADAWLQLAEHAEKKEGYGFRVAPIFRQPYTGARQ